MLSNSILILVVFLIICIAQFSPFIAFLLSALILVAEGSTAYINKDV